MKVKVRLEKKEYRAGETVHGTITIDGKNDVFINLNQYDLERWNEYYFFVDGKEVLWTKSKPTFVTYDMPDSVTGRPYTKRKIYDFDVPVEEIFKINLLPFLAKVDSVSKSSNLKNEVIPFHFKIPLGAPPTKDKMNKMRVYYMVYAYYKIPPFLHGNSEAGLKVINKDYYKYISFEKCRACLGRGYLDLQTECEKCGGVGFVNGSLSTSYAGNGTSEKKSQLISLLQKTLSAAPKKTIKELENAIQHLEKSLDPKFWNDSNTLDSKQGGKTFDEDKKAIEKLMKIDTADKWFEDLKKTDHKYGAIYDRIVDLVKIDLKIARDAIDAASRSENVSNKKSSKEIEKAIEELSEEYYKYNVEEFDRFIEQCKKSWEHAQKAIEH